MSTYKPNRKLYMSLLASSIVVTLIALIIPSCNPWFTVVTGIGCGGIASVIVAWLIEAANCREKKTRSKEVYEILWTCLTFCAYSYASMYKTMYETEQKKIEGKHTWLEWKNMLISNLQKTPENKGPEKLKSVFMNYSGDILTQMKYFTAQRSQLIADGFMTSNDYYLLHEIKQKVELCETMMSHGTYKETAYFLSSLGRSLEHFFNQNSELKKYNTLAFNDLVDLVEEEEKANN